jgi:hypothetical protein
MRQALVAASLFGLVAVGSWVLRPRSDPRSGSVIVRDGTVRIGARVPEVYRIVYRSHVAGAGTTTREILVRRPFDSREGDNVSAFARVAVGSGSFFAPPGPPAGDLRADAVLPEAVRDGFAQKRELRRVAGRLCRVFRIGAPSVSGRLPRVAASDEKTDVCVDEAGFVLEEVTYDGDEVSRRRVAETVAEGPRLPDDAFEIAEPDADPRQVGSVQELEADSRLPGGAFWELPDAPKGFRSRGRFAVVPAGQPGFSDPTARTSVISFVSEVWTNGPDVFVVEQGATQGSVAFEDDPDAMDVRAGDLGKGQLLYSMVASEVRVRTTGSRFVRVRGTLAPSELLEVARDLDDVDGGPLRLKGARS